ncbi:unnamed protein product, partial [Oppiella nova]
MELCECTLRQLITAKDQLFKRENTTEPGHLEFFISITWLNEIAQGLKYLHTHKPPIMHRDLKPENIFMATVKPNTVLLKLGDFGLAKIQAVASQTNTRKVGTPIYMAPEVCAEEDYKKYDIMCDMYSLGMFIKELFNFDYNEEQQSTQIQGEVVSEIGRGTFGVVHKVRYLSDDQQNDCTLKVIDIKETKENDLHIEEDEKKSLQLLQGLDNNYIIKYYGSWFKTNHIFIQMELCQCTLRQLIVSKDKLFDRILNSEPGDLEFFISIAWLKEIVQGLMYLHKQEKPLIHRDLRPENIFMASYDADSICLKLGDFGLARIQDIASQSNSRGVGSPQYLAPEICADEDYKLGDFGLARIQDIASQSNSRGVGSPQYLAPEICADEDYKKYNVSADMYSLGMFITELFKFDYTEEPHDKRMVNIQAM